MVVNFLIVGTQKGGTTALAHFLSEHPDICFAPSKEVHFFDYDRHYSLGIDYYHSFFPNYTNQTAVGEATPIYMYLPHVPERIYCYNPHMKLIVLLRNPIDRAYSQYQMELKRGWETLPFSLAIALEPLRLLFSSSVENERSARRVHSYCDRGNYVKQLKLLDRYFPKEQVLILLQQDLEQNHQQTLERVYNFLGVSVPVNFPARQKVLVGEYQPLPPEIKLSLIKRFTPEILHLQQLIDRDLHSWLQL